MITENKKMDTKNAMEYCVIVVAYLRGFERIKILTKKLMQR